MTNSKKIFLLIVLVFVFTNISSAQSSQVLTFPLVNVNDDVEVRTSNSAVDFTSSDLELQGRDNSNSQVSYVRFQNVTLPVGALIQSAELIFRLKDRSTVSSQLNIFGEVGNSAVFTSVGASYSSRNYTNAISWDTPLPTTKNVDYNSPNLSSIINQIFPNGLNASTIGFKITGNQVGTFNVFSRNGSSSAGPRLRITYTINVVPIPVTNLTLSCGSSQIQVGNVATITPNFQPANATNKTISWQSSNTAVATISNSGVVNATGIGQVTITATTIDGSFSGSCTYTVTGEPNAVVYKWSGALMPTSIKINAKLTNTTNQARALASTNYDLSNPVYSEFKAINETTNRMGSFEIKDLQPNTNYYYAIESNGIIDINPNSIGQFKTPNIGAFSYSFTTGSCSSNSAKPVWQKISDKNALFFLALGDLHYADPSSLTASRTAYENLVLNVTNTKNLFNKTPMAYMWDDHDFAGNDSQATSSNANGAKQAYREYVPHYPFANSISNPPINQTFTIGRVKFILMDLRSEKSSSQLCSISQVEWFKNECRLARDNNQIIAWISSYGVTSSSSDSWGGNLNYRNQRNNIFNFFKQENINNLFLMSGDAHSAGIDDGQNTDCLGVVNSNSCPRSTNSTNPRFPLIQAAALYPAYHTSSKGIITNAVPMTGLLSTGQYAKIDVNDNGGNTIQICTTLYRVSDSGVETVLGNFCFTRDLSVIVSNKTLINDNSDWKYFDKGYMPTNWNASKFNDSKWKSGLAPLGYGVSGIATNISSGTSLDDKYRTTYFRKNITINDINNISDVSLNAKLKDGVVFYINGVEIARTTNLPKNQVFSTLANSVEDSSGNSLFFPIDLNVFKKALINGTNVLSAEVHLHSASSSDIFFSAELNVKIFSTKSNGTNSPSVNQPVSTEQDSFVLYETNIGKQIEFYPNPSDGKLVIKNNILDYKNRKIGIYNMQGIQVFEKEIEEKTSSLEFDLKHLSSQIYIIIISDGNNVIFSNKWIKK